MSGRNASGTNNVNIVINELSETTPEVGLSQLTLIMLTYKREAYALRAMAYWSRLGVTLHVIDGSSSPIDASLRSGLGDNIHYHHRPVGIMERVKEAIPLVHTPYASFISDDEFYLKNGIVAAIRALEDDAELVSCGGQCIGFWPSKKNTILSEKDYPMHQDWARAEDSPSDRIIRHFTRYTPAIFYSIARADFLLDALHLVVEREFNAFAMAELQYELYALWCGKAKRLDNIFWLRSYENPPTRGTDASLRPEKRVHEWWRNPEMRSEVDSFVASMAKHMARHGGTTQEAEAIVRQAMDAHAAFLDFYYAPKSYTARRICGGVIRRARRTMGLTPPLRKGIPLRQLLMTYEPDVAEAAKEDLLALDELLVNWHNRLE